MAIVTMYSDSVYVCNGNALYLCILCAQLLATVFLGQIHTCVDLPSRLSDTQCCRHTQLGSASQTDYGLAYHNRDTQ